jgi:hypothetical protein
MPCDLAADGRRYTGLVLDLSPSGLYVQTSAKLRPGERAGLVFGLPGAAGRVDIEVEVVRRKAVPARLRNLAQGGIGVRIVNAPNTYFSFVQVLTNARVGEGNTVVSVSAKDIEKALARGTKSTPKAAARIRFRVRVSQTSGPRSRIVTVEGASEDDARGEALAQVGEGWKVLQVEQG